MSEGLKGTKRYKVEKRITETRVEYYESVEADSPEDAIATVRDCELAPDDTDYEDDGEAYEVWDEEGDTFLLEG